MNLAAQKVGLFENPPEQPGVGSNARNRIFIKGAAQSRNGLFPAVAPGNELAHQGVIIVGNRPAFVHAFIHADSRAAGSVPRQNLSRRREEVVLRILGVKPDFHCMTAWSDGFPSKWQAMPCCNRDLQFDEIQACDLLRNRMLHLQTRIHFQEIKIQVLVHEEFHGAGVNVAARACQPHRSLAHSFAQFRRNNRRGRFFDHFLVTTLD